ncbi:CCR4-NOT transcription complex subunit 10-like isoform X1 [Neltuma alba]|uniref:CCR4-NOT transcription complex subunit 10-like isoform X1 n=1 Tax=Neltuma alba TaxID=207710 RepID=UPI0010A3FBF5|nr:CCR4-NOT transcription complex subunit 10-like isoform X1 [Prosopis alba]
MEVRDLTLLPSSASTTLPAPSHDGSSPVDASDDASFSVTVALAKDAALHFQSGKFAECVEVLKQLLQMQQDDPKMLVDAMVFHNIAITKSFQDGSLNPQKLLEVLNCVKRKCDELARASGEHGESVKNVGNKVVLGSKGSNALSHQFSGAHSTTTTYTDGFDSSVAILNIAIIWYHLHEYRKTLSVLEPLYQNIEPIDETTALHVCLLLLDASLACCDASKSADVLSYLERAFSLSNASQGDNGNTAQQQSANLITKSSSIPSGPSAADTSSSDLGPAANASENNLSRAFSEEALGYEALMLDMGGQNLTSPAGLSSNDLSMALVDRFSNVELKLKLQLYKVEFLLLTRNLKLAKREVKLAMNIARGRDSSMALLLKSQLEYARHNHRKAIKLLMVSNNRTDPAFLSIFHNNLGCIYYQLGKYQTSSLFFSKALTNCSSLRKNQPLKMPTFSQDNALLIVYNCGMQYLACGKPLLAARCFQKSSMVFYNKPLLWLRLAECCLMALEKGLIKSSRVLPTRLEVGVHVVGKGKWRQLVLNNEIPRNGCAELLDRYDCHLKNDVQLNLSMSLARQFLLNVLYLLDSNKTDNLKSGLPFNSLSEENHSGDVSSGNSNNKNLLGINFKAFSLALSLGQANSNGDVKEQKGGTNQEVIQSSLSHYEDMCRRENLLIKQVALANLAYVELELDNPVKALSVATSLLELPECSRIYLFLGHVYSAEALCLLNRPKEAAEHLSIYLSGGYAIELPFSQDDCKKWQVERTAEFEDGTAGSAPANISSSDDFQRIDFLKPEEARGIIYANFAALSAMQGELDQAHQLVAQALSILPNSPEATITAIYVDLLLGKPKEALSKLKQCSRVRFLPSAITLNKS